MYLSDHFVKLNIIVDLGLLVILIWAPTHMVTSHSSVSPAHMLEGSDGQQLRAITAAASAFAGELVWPFQEYSYVSIVADAPSAYILNHG